MTTEIEKPLEILLENVRLGSVSLTTPFIGKDAKIDPATGKAIGLYHVDGIMDLNHPQIPAIKQLMRTAIERLFKDNAPDMIVAIATKDKLCLHEGNKSKPGKPAYKDKVFISANNKEQPTILVTENGVNIANRDTIPLFTPSHKCWPYAGCYANLLLRIKAYNFDNGKSQGVSAYVNGVQFLNHGERIGGGSMVASVGQFGLTAREADGAPPAAAAANSGAGLI